MRGVYTAQGTANNVNNARSLLVLTAGSAVVVEIIEAHVTVSNSTADFSLECALTRISTLGSPTGTALTPKPSEEGDQAATSTVTANVTASEPTYGPESFGLENQPSRGGWHFTPIRPIYVKPAGNIGLRTFGYFSSTNYSLDVQLVFREMG